MHQNDQQEKNSLYDFIYVDIGKLKSYCSQLDELGLLNTITTSGINTTSKTEKFGTGRNPVVDLSSENKSSTNQSLTQTFDHMESLPYKTIEMLNANNLINYNITNASYGQIVLISGNSNLYDFSMICSSWEGLIRMYEKNENIKQGKNPKNKELSSEGKMIVKMLESMPPLMSFKIKDENNNIAWAGLETQHLIGSSFGYTLKYGTAMHGKWYTLGVLDAMPHESSQDNVYSEESFLPALRNMNSAIKSIMGRKDDEFGITPIAIWRTLE